MNEELDLFPIERKELVMPSSFIGKETKKTEFTLSAPRKWTDEEIEFVRDAHCKGYSIGDIAMATGRTEVSISVKLKRLGKSGNKYNTDHISDKYSANERFARMIQPTSILDLYCGENRYWSQRFENVVTNDKNTEIGAMYHLDSLVCACQQYAGGHRFDLIDIDPFGSAYDCFDLCVKMATKGIIITFGELGHKRFKRLDFVRRYYGIDRLEEFTIDNLIKEVVRIGERNKKILTPVITKEWRMIGRVYFTISPMRITEQWNKRNESNIFDKGPQG